MAIENEEARLKIHELDGTKIMIEYFQDMDAIVQLETLAALTNLTLSFKVADDMVKKFNGIPFFLGLASSNKPKHSQFAAMALGNIARDVEFRELIRTSGGIQILVGCVLSHDYSKRRYGCMALANLAISNTDEIEQVFVSKGLLGKVLKIAWRNEVDTQREVIALLRNLTCHNSLRRLLFDRGILKAIKKSEKSGIPEVVEWCREITKLIEKEYSLSKGKEIYSESNDMLAQMTPLEAGMSYLPVTIFISSSHIDTLVQSNSLSFVTICKLLYFLFYIH